MLSNVVALVIVSERRQLTVSRVTFKKPIEPPLSRPSFCRREQPAIPDSPAGFLESGRGHRRGGLRSAPQS